VFELSYLASAHRKPQPHDRLVLRSHATAAKIDMDTSNRLDVDSCNLRCGSGPGRDDSWWIGNWARY
jgi:hypothetical protein